jgi:hypothetical protein
MPSPTGAGWQVFLSSTSSDLSGYRKAAADEIARLRYFGVEQMEDWGARAARAAEQCEDKLRSCDVYLAIIGYRYGSRVPADRVPARLAGHGQAISYTEYEYELARALGLPRLVYLLEPDAIDESAAQISARALLRIFAVLATGSAWRQSCSMTSR